MKFDEARDRIMELLLSGSKRPYSANDLALVLDLRGKDKKSLLKWLTRLSRDGEILLSKSRQCSLPLKDSIFSARLRMLRSGNGLLVNPDSGVEVFVPGDELGRALPGDLVLARVRKDSPDGSSCKTSPRQRIAGSVVRILERSQRELVGTLCQIGPSRFVTPLDPCVGRMFRVADTRGAQSNDRVVIKFIQWEKGCEYPEGEILEVLGSSDDPSTDTISIIRHYGFRTEFPSEVLAEADSSGDLAAAPGPREDLREQLVVTIDPATARDFDDAVSFRMNSHGQRVLGVHIADVSHFVRSGGVLDLEARERGNSVYLPDKVIPMLPETLSNGICSLRPLEERLTLSALMTFDRSGQVVEQRFAKTMIRSSLRLTYEEAMSILKGQSTPSLATLPGQREASAVRELLMGIHALAQELRVRRFSEHALDLDMPECEVIFDQNKTVSDVRLVWNDPSHQLIEECMVAANEAVATELESHGIRIISRLHEAPDDEKIEALKVTLAEMGYSPGNLRHQQHLADFLRKVKSDALSPHIQMAVLRTMKRAMYSATAQGHYGLAKKRYAHFTSPIRRYTDITLHRQLTECLGLGNGVQQPTKPVFRDTGSMSAIARWCSETEHKADEAERALTDILKFRFLKMQLEKRTVKIYEAVVVEVVYFGLFVEACELQVSGLVHVSLLGGWAGVSETRFDRRRRILTVGRTSWRQGQKLKVMISRVDMDRRQLDFVPADTKGNA